jgi:hypothetical protein
MSKWTLEKSLRYVYKTITHMAIYPCLDETHILFSYAHCNELDLCCNGIWFTFLRTLKRVRIASNSLCFHRYLSLYSPSSCASSLPTPQNSLQNSRLNRPPLPPPETATSVACSLRPTWPPRTPHHHTWPHRTWPHRTLLRRTQHHRTWLRPMSLPRTPPRHMSLLITLTAPCRLTLLTRTSPRLSLHRTLITRELHLKHITSCTSIKPIPELPGQEITCI